MNKYVIQGGQKLSGKVEVSGSKNAALPILAATLLTDEDIVLHNVPFLRDTQTMISLLAVLGKKVVLDGSSVTIKTESPEKYQATYDIVKQMRASIVVLGPLLAKLKKAHVSLPGGCAFGPRPVDLHLKGVEALGAKIAFNHGYIDASAEKLTGCSIDLTGEFGPSVLATDNVAMAATLAEGETVIENAAREPETQDLMAFLRAMGADISGEGSSVLKIRGVEKLQGCEYTISQDRIEAGTYAVIAAMIGAEIDIAYSEQHYIENVLQVLGKMGVNFTRDNETIRFSKNNPQDYEGFDILTMPYPGFPTDMQPIFLSFGCVLNKKSTITESIYPNRWNHAPELIRMGADIKIEKNMAIIGKKGRLEGASVQASDLRAGAALIAAALVAEGDTEVRRIYHVERGYEKMPQKLSSLGAVIQSVPDSLV